MAVYVVDYDLRQPDHDYRPRIDALRQYESCHALKPTWFIDSTLSGVAIRADPRQHQRLHQNDQLYVLRINRAGHGTASKNAVYGLLIPFAPIESRRGAGSAIRETVYLDVQAKGIDYPMDDAVS